MDYYVLAFADGSNSLSSKKMDSEEALVWQARVESREGATGTLFTLTQWQATNDYDAVVLQEAKNAKKAEIRNEGVTRLPDGLKNVEILPTILKCVVDQGLTPAGQEADAVYNAARGAIRDVQQLTTLEAVMAYDAVTDPAWPA